MRKWGDRVERALLWCASSEGWRERQRWTRVAENISILLQDIWFGSGYVQLDMVQANLLWKLSGFIYLQRFVVSITKYTDSPSVYNHGQIQLMQKNCWTLDLMRLENKEKKKVLCRFFLSPVSRGSAIVLSNFSLPLDFFPNDVFHIFTRQRS